MQVSHVGYNTSKTEGLKKTFIYPLWSVSLSVSYLCRECCEFEPHGWQSNHITVQIGSDCFRDTVWPCAISASGDHPLK